MTYGTFAFRIQPRLAALATLILGDFWICDAGGWPNVIHVISAPTGERAQNSRTVEISCTAATFPPICV